MRPFSRFFFPLILGCWILQSCIPDPPSYPYKPAAQIRQEASTLSANLESYIKGWLDGVNPPQIPDSLIPDGVTYARSFMLTHPDSITSNDTWAYRFAKPINTDSIYNSLPDPHVTYLLMGPSLAPFGSKLHVEGEFPHCRFFSLQITPPLSGEEYTYDRAFGSAEVSIADVDIDPFPGHTNPFRIGADRNATDRSYHVTFNLEIGDPVALSGGKYAPPFRYPGNERNGGLLMPQGPWGISGGFNGITPGNGEWSMGALWVRMYAPDGPDPMAGVAAPKVYYELPDGRKYAITADFEAFRQRTEKTVPAQESFTRANNNISPDLGWQKSYGILMNILVGVSQVNGWLQPDSQAKIRAVDLGVTGRSQSAPAPRNYEAHATINNYTSYVGKYVRLDTGMVAVLTGKMPTFPDTRNGLTTMTDAQCRYWSITGYDSDPFFAAPGSAVNSILDDQVKLDDDRNFVLVYSRQQDKPQNALLTNGATWINWGPTMDLGVVIRMVTLGNEWNFPNSPTAPSLPWKTGNLASPDYDSTLINQNWHKGYMGCYLPRMHLMTTQEFEKLGTNLKFNDIPISVHNRFEIGLSDAMGLPISASSVKDSLPENAISNANDVDFNSAWVSQNLSSQTQSEWIEIDLLEERQISAVKLSWVLLGHARSYTIEVSPDKANWTRIHEEQNGNGLNDIIDRLDSAFGRYVRINMNRAVLFNYALQNFEVYCPEITCLNSQAPVGLSSVLQDAERIQVFPNPYSDRLYIEVLDGVRYDHLKIFDLSGKEVFASPFQEMLRPELKPGVYFLQVVGSQGSQVVKVVQQ